MVAAPIPSSSLGSAYLAALLAGFAVTPAFGQIPGPADPARVISDQELPTRRFDEGQRSAAPVVTQDPVVTVPEGADRITFPFRALAVDGMTAYSAEQIETLYAEYVGQDITLATLFGIMGRLQKKYLDDGYALSKVTIPDQNLKEEVTRLHVIEGHVAEVEIGPGIAPSPALDDAIARIKAMRPLNTVRLERILLLLNDLPGVKLSAILATLSDDKTRAAQPGAVRLILQKIALEPTHGRVSVDNYGSDFAGPFQATVNGHVTDIGIANSDLNLTLSATKPLREQRYGALRYDFPIWGISGAKLAFSAIVARTEPGDSLRILDIEGKSKAITAALSYPFIRQRDRTLTVDGALAYKDANTDLLGSELYDDRLRIASIGANYSFSDSTRGFNALDLHFAQGLDIAGARDAGSFNLSRADGRPDFSKFEFFAGRVQALPGDFELYGLVSGQYAFNPLLSSEEFGFGGGQVGRGYDPSEITGDRGVSASVELRYKKQMTALNQDVVAQPYVFFDAGKVWNIDRGAKDGISAMSAGIGTRLHIDESWDSNISLAVPLTKNVDNPPGYSSPEGPRILVSLSYSF